MTLIAAVLVPFAVNNSKWEYDDSNPTFHIWKFATANNPGDLIDGFSSSIFGLLAVYNPPNTAGEVTFTNTIISGSGNETTLIIISMLRLWTISVTKKTFNGYTLKARRIIGFFVLLSICKPVVNFINYC